jgi:membrane protein DedA with SNARE-associated domain
MGESAKYFAVYIAGITGLWKGIPLGIGLNLDPFFTGLFTGLGSVTTVLILFLAGESFRKWILNKYGEKRIEKKKNNFSQMANRYGIWGLGLVTAGLLGPYTSMLLGFILIKEIRKFLLILMTGIFIWSFVFAYFFSSIVDFILKIKNL